ncbi:MAG TPA: STAS-like domain-containing protein [bacterium]|jgi:Icc-related predicted phosphoesterase|nr:STAS-like domain-containing protein [bacterium]
MEELHINVFNIVGNSLCVEADDGEKVFIQVSAALKSGKIVVLSFQNVEMLTSAFLNTAIGQLYRDFSESEIKESLTVIQLEGADRILLKRVVDTAKLFYKDPARLEKSINEIMGD